MPKVDLDQVPVKTGSSYPGDLAQRVHGRVQRPVSRAGGITQFGANIVVLAPGALSSLRHWHEQQDEFLVILHGTGTLIDDNGKTPLHPGDCAAFPAGDGNGHHVANETQDEVRFLVVGTHTPTEVAHYSDVDLRVSVDADGFRYTRRDGSPLEDG